MCAKKTSVIVKINAKTALQNTGTVTKQDTEMDLRMDKLLKEKTEGFGLKKKAKPKKLGHITR